MADRQLIQQLELALVQASSAVTVQPEVTGASEAADLPVLENGTWRLPVEAVGCTLLCPGDIPGAKQQLSLAAALAMALAHHRRSDPQERWRRQLEGEAPPELPPGKRRVLALQMLDGNPVQILQEMLPLQAQDVLVFMHPDTAALIKDVTDMPEKAALEEYVQALRDTLLSEAGCDVAVGVSDLLSGPEMLADAWHQARQALLLGQRFHPGKQLFYWNRLVVERLLDEIPPDRLERYHSLLFNRKTARLLSDEMLQTIETFLESDLNLSDTARKLYIHRNTLIYRLDKVLEHTGLDLRRLDDALSFRILLYLRRGDPAQGENKNRRIKK